MRKKRIRDICLGITDGSHNPPQGGDVSDFLMISSKNIYDDQITLDDPRFLTEEQFTTENKRTKIQPSDVLMTIVGTVGRTAVVNENLGNITLQRSVAVLHPNNEICNSRFLMYALRSKRTFFEKEAHGVAQKGLYLKQLSDIEIAVPDLNHQLKYVDSLDKVCGIIRERQKQLERLDELIKARFVEMFGNPVTNDRGWSTDSCKNLMRKIGSGATPKGGRESYCDEGISLIRSMNVYNNKFEYKDLAHITDEQAKQLDNVNIEKSDVLLNITGASVARCCVVPNDLLPARVNQHVSIIRCKERLLPNFVCCMFTEDNYQRLLWNIATAGGATREAITKQQIEDLIIIVPPVDLQKQFTEFTKQVDKSKVVVQKSLDETKTLFDSLMQKYFG